LIILPIRSDRRLRSTPWVNYALIAANAVVFVLTSSRVSQPFGPVHDYLLDPTQPRVFEFITYQFLHANVLHILGNMLFLYVFGNALEDRLGKVGYLAFYLAGGVIAGLGHVAVERAPVLGASGAVAAVSGAYLALFPLSNVTMFYWFFLFVGSFEVSGLVLIGFYIAMNVWMQLSGGDQVAYLAHLSGYLIGFGVGMGLLWAHLVPREPCDFLALIERRRRRAQFARITRSGYQPWQGRPGGGAWTDHQPDRAPPAGPAMEARSAVLQAAAGHDLPLAARLYQRLLELDPQAVLPETLQLDVAHELMSETQYLPAAHAYERFLLAYPRYAQRPQVQLILGLIYARYLKQTDRARELLAQAAAHLLDAEQRGLAHEVLAELSR